MKRKVVFSLIAYVMLICPTAFGHEVKNKKIGNMYLNLQKLPKLWSFDDPSIYDNGGELNKTKSQTDHSIRFRALSDDLGLLYSKSYTTLNGHIRPNQEFVTVSIEEYDGKSFLWGGHVQYKRLLRQGVIKKIDVMNIYDRSWRLNSYSYGNEYFGRYSQIDYISNDVLLSGNPMVVCHNYAPMPPYGPETHPLRPEIECAYKISSKNVVVEVIFSAFSWRETPNILSASLNLVSCLSGRNVFPN